MNLWIRTAIEAYAREGGNARRVDPASCIVRPPPDGGLVHERRYRGVTLLDAAGARLAHYCVRLGAAPKATRAVARDWRVPVERSAAR